MSSPRKGDTAIHHMAFNTVETPKKIEMPPGAAEFAIGDGCSPTSSCFLMTRSISRSSTSFSCAGEISSLACCSRAFFSAAGRNRLPTCRRETAVLCVVTLSLPFYITLSPNLFGKLNNHSQFRPLLILARILPFGGSKPHWRRKTSCSSGTNFAPDRYGLDVVFQFQTARFCCHQPQFDGQATRYETQRLVTTKSGRLESKDDIKRRIDRAAKFVPLEQLCLSPQCGFASTEEGNILAEDEQWAKLRMIVEIAEEVWS